MRAHFDGIIRVGRERTELNRLAIHHQGQVGFLLDQAQTVVFDLVDGAMALGDTLAGELEIHAFPGADLKGQLLDLAGFASQAIHRHPFNLAQ